MSASANGRAPTLLRRVAEARMEDLGRGVARLDGEALLELGIEPGAIVEIIGSRTTPGIALLPFPDQETASVIGLDELGRTNAGIALGDYVEVRAAAASSARRVVLAPAQKSLRLQGSGQNLVGVLNGRPVTPGDLVSTSVYRRASGLEGGFFPDDAVGPFAEPRYALQEVRLIVTSTTPRGIVRVLPDTQIEILPEYVEPETPDRQGIGYRDVGGFERIIDQVREVIELPLLHPELFLRFGIDPPKGMLLHGPPGTGKTLLARAVANESKASFLHVAGPEIMGRFYGESEERLRQIFEQAKKRAPSILFMDEIDSIAPKRDRVGSDVERRVVSQLLTLMDGLEPRQNVVVIGATNQVESLDEALRRPGRFDREIFIGPPDVEGRRRILEIHTRDMPLARAVDLSRLAEATHGFVGADLAALSREAAIDSLRRTLPSHRLEERVLPPRLLDGLRVEPEDFTEALKRVRPSALREIAIQVPRISWDDIGGLEAVKRKLVESIELPLKEPEAFRRIGIRPAKGFLFFGPPGTGKTLMAKAVAGQCRANFIAAKSSDLLSKWHGESEKQIARMFARARQVAPAVLFLDELDSIAPLRGGFLGEPAVTERVVNTLLAEMDGLEELEGVVVIGATNRPNLLDPALLRPGRFDELVFIPVPDREGRLSILRIHTRDMPLAEDADLSRLADRTAGFTGADLEDLVRRAGLLALREEGLQVERVSMRFFQRALAETRASVTSEMEAEYLRIAESLKRERPRRPLGFSPPTNA